MMMWWCRPKKEQQQRKKQHWHLNLLFSSYSGKAVNLSHVHCSLNYKRTAFENSESNCFTMGFLDTIINEEEPEVIEKRNNAARSRLVAALLLVVVISGVSYVVDAIEAED